jgi:NTP pyrophosphatase (non-canonical NTP hydrolase)
MTSDKVFQDRVVDWLIACFGTEIASDQTERCHRFVEESLELAQAVGCTKSDVLQLVDYVYARPAGDKNQEAGGTLITLAALCNASRISMDAAGEAELTRVWAYIDRIREKQAKKPKNKPLPQ